MHHYFRFFVMIVLSFAAMYVLMYAMVDTLGDVYPNLNQLYMAGLMAASMAVIEIALMWKMYANRIANTVILVAGAVALVIFWALIRQQSAIADVQFLKSMIPHHSGAILMCQRASIGDPEIKELCGTIVAGQRSEIEQMRGVLGRLDGATTP
jgi:uncharacterized protein (DUF305 family)